MQRKLDWWEAYTFLIGRRPGRHPSSKTSGRPRGASRSPWRALERLEDRVLLAGAFPIQPVAVNGDPAAVTPVDNTAKFGFFDQVVVGEGTNIAFQGSAFGASSHFGLWAGQAGDLKFIAQNGGAAPGAGANYEFVPSGLGDRIISAGGGVVTFLADLDSSSTTDDAVYAGTGGAIQLAAREGSPAGGTGATFESDFGDPFGDPLVTERVAEVGLKRCARTAGRAGRIQGPNPFRSRAVPV
jgi:hypothetical protein